MTSNTFIVRSNIKNLIIKIKQSSFLKNILIVMGGTAIAQIIAYALSPIKSRLFTPEDFGIFGSFIAVAGIVGAHLTLDYCQAQMLPKEKHDGINLFCFSIISTFIITLNISAVSIIKPSLFYNLTKTKGFCPILLFLTTLIIAGINQASQAWAVLSKAFKTTPASQIIHSVGSSGSRILSGIIKAGSLGLIISNIVTNILASINLVQIVIPDLKSLRTVFKLQKMKRPAKEYKDFPLYSASQSFINAISSGLPVLLITKYFGISAAGSYALGLNILQAPMSLVLTALRKVIFQKACEIQHEGRGIFFLYVRTIIVLFALAFLPSIILLIWAPQIFTLVFGPRWQLAGILARSLTMWMLFIFSRDIDFWRQVLSFDGSLGVGVGLLSQRPVSCTTEDVAWRATYENSPPKWLIKRKFCERPVQIIGTILRWHETRTGNVLVK